MKLTSLLVLLLPSLLFGIPETWNSSTTYQKNDVVLYTPSGASVAQNYIALQTGAGQQPDTSTAFWSSLDSVASEFSPPPGDPSTFNTPDTNTIPTNSHLILTEVVLQPSDRISSRRHPHGSFHSCPL